MLRLLQQVGGEGGKGEGAPEGTLAGRALPPTHLFRLTVKAGVGVGGGGGVGKVGACCPSHLCAGCGRRGGTVPGGDGVAEEASLMHRASGSWPRGARPLTRGCWDGAGSMCQEPAEGPLEGEDGPALRGQGRAARGDP